MQIKYPDRQLPLFKTRMMDVLNPDHELIRAVRRIDWKEIHEFLLPCYSSLGRMGKPIRLMAGLYFLKIRFDCSDATAVEELHENVYWQYFCGFSSFQKGPLLDATSLVRFRKRIGEDRTTVLDRIFEDTWKDLPCSEKKVTPRFRTLPSFLRKRRPST